METKPRTDYLTKKNYESNHMIHPNGEFMCFITDKKVKSYLRNKLGTIVRVNEDGSQVLQINFEPKGMGGISEYEKSPKDNICVVTGVSEFLTRHHVIPSIYRKHFPMIYKEHNSHDIVLMCTEKHYEYERMYANNFADELAREYGAMTLNEFIEVSFEKINRAKLAHTIITLYNKNITQKSQKIRDRISDLIQRYENLTGLEAIPANLRMTMKDYNNGKHESEYGEYFVKFIPDIEEFCLKWRTHFFETMHPQFLPKGWKLDGLKKY